VRVITKGLVELKLLKGSVPKLIKEQAYRKFYMHRTGHWLGLDVHDVGDYKVGDQWRLLEPGMVMTIEPGIYIPAKTRGVHRRWWDIGIRIEDDVLVTRQGYEILTDALPRKASEIEALPGRAVRGPGNAIPGASRQHHRGGGSEQTSARRFELTFDCARR
jgi:Xaa-Pro aminopeptidase